MNVLESSLYKEFPRVAVQAETMGFCFDDINYLYNKILNSNEANNLFKTNEHKQIVLKMILYRVGLEKVEFFKHIAEIGKKSLSDGELEKECGKYSIKAYRAILS